MKLKKVFVLSVFFLIAAVSVSAQNSYTISSSKAIKLYEEGKKSFRMMAYAESEAYLKKAIKTENSFIEAYMVLAKLYWDIDSLDLAIENYRIGLAIDPSYYTHGYVYKGRLELLMGRYVDASESFKSLLALEKKNEKLIQVAQKGLLQSEFALKLKQNPVDFEKQLLDTTINSPDDEYWPSLSADEKTLVFTRLVGSSKKSRVQEDFYISTNEEEEWSLAENMGRPLNTYDNEGAQTISADGKLMVYTVCNRQGVIGRCDLYFTEKKGQNWTLPINIGKPVNSAAKETQPSLSSDGRTLYFSSDRSGGKGGFDIWVSNLNDDGIWSIPTNLGDSVNTSGNEISPFIHHDNQTLYFSSDKHLGMGKFDIFISRKDDKNKWGKPENIGYPINTHKDEIGLIVSTNAERAYYSSNIEDSRGKDIYSFVLHDKAKPLQVSYMKGMVYDATNRKALRAAFEVIRLDNGEVVNKSFSDSYTGEFLICIPADKSYMLNVSKENYLFYSENFSLDGIHLMNEPYYKDVPLEPLRVGKKIILKNIFFETDSYQLMGSSALELDKLVKFLALNKTVRIEISGHTDNEGSEAYNQTLSEKRAESVVNFLIGRGIVEDRLVFKGYGLLQPIESNDTKEGRAKNRRTELTVIN